MDVVRAAQLGIAAQAVRLEQMFEDEILTTAVQKLASHRGNARKQAQDLRELRELVRRDKRAVEVLSNVVGGSSEVSLQNYVAWLWVGASVVTC
jgi:L-lactate utilization protein LutB